MNNAGIHKIYKSDYVRVIPLLEKKETKKSNTNGQTLVSFSRICKHHIR